MTLHHADPWLTIYGGDARAVLAELPAESVHCVVTSPPYWGLRDYGLLPSVWGGPSDPTQHIHDWTTKMCACGAWLGCLGLEPTPEMYVEHVIEVFREVRRVLRRDGTLWLNLGDCYAGGGRGGDLDGKSTLAGTQTAQDANAAVGRVAVPSGLKPKDLVMMPARVAMALQADGWWLRKDIIWAKPNPMPESVTDRPTSAHEYVFLLSKAARYFWDAEAVREPMAESSMQRIQQPTFDQQTGGPKDYGEGSNRSARKALENLRARNVGGRGDGFTRMPGGEAEWSEQGRSGRNLRSVWTIATEPYPGAHFATFPRKLVEPCIRAGTSERGVCPECGAPWRRVVEREGIVVARGNEPHLEHRGVGRSAGGLDRDIPTHYKPTISTTGWLPSCDCRNTIGQYADNGPYPPVPAVVLDCFAGTGTVGLVAQHLSRRAVLVDLNADYLLQCLHRNRQTPLGLVG